MWTTRGHTRASLGLIFSPPYRRVTRGHVVLSFCTLYAYWAFNFWVPAYLLATGRSARDWPGYR